MQAHPRFGPVIRDWQAHGAVGGRAKWLASATMTVSAAILWWLAPRPWMAALGIGCMIIVAIWLWSRPEPSR